MKKIFILIFSFFYFNAFSQSPEKFTYQSIVKNSSGYLIKSKDLGLRISILKNSNEGISVYSETHTTKTNINGLLTLNIGEGSSSDDFSAINWSSAEYFLKVEVDPMGGSNYLIETTSQLLSVPYALYAASSKQELVLKGQDYLKLNENDLTIEKVDLKEDVKEILPIANGGTGSITAPMIGLITAADSIAALQLLGAQAINDRLNEISNLATTDKNVIMGDGTNFVLKAPLDALAALAGQPLKAPLTDIGALAVTNRNFIMADGTNFVLKDSSAVLTALGGQPLKAPLTDIGALAATTNNFIIGDGTNFILADPAASLTALGAGTMAVQNKETVDIDGGAIDGTNIGATAAATGAFSTLSVSNGSTASGAIQLFENSDNGTDKITLIAPEDLADTSTVFTLPAADGSSEQLLKTNGSGVLSFTTISSDAIVDADANTKIQVEESADEDIIRVDIAGTEQFIISDGVLEPTTDDDIDLGSSTKEFKDAYIDGILYADVLNVEGASTLTGNVTAAGSVDITGAGGLILENDNTITNPSAGLVTIASASTTLTGGLGIAGALDLVNLTNTSGGTVTVNAQAGQVKVTSTTTKVNNSFITSANDIVILTWAQNPGSNYDNETLYVGTVNASGYFQIKLTGSGSVNAKVNFLIIK